MIVQGNTPQALDYALRGELNKNSLLRSYEKDSRVSEIRHHTLDFLLHNINTPATYNQRDRKYIRKEATRYVKGQMTYGFWSILLPILISFVVRLIVDWFFSSSLNRNKAHNIAKQ